MLGSGEVTARLLLHQGPYRVHEVIYPPGLRQPLHAHPHASLTVVLSGSLREQMGRREETADSLSVVAKPPGVEHRDEYGPQGAHTFQVAFDPDAVLGGSETDRLLPGWRWLHGAPAAAPLLALWRSLRSGGSGSLDVEEVDERTLSALASVSEDGARSSDPPGWLEAARRALDESLPTGMSVRRLAEIADVHPVSLSRAFHRHYGRTVTDYRRRERVRRAAARLRETCHEVSRIAHASGFADHAHLCRVFREATGLTPTEFRHMAPKTPEPGS